MPAEGVRIYFQREKGGRVGGKKRYGLKRSALRDGYAGTLSTERERVCCHPAPWVSTTGGHSAHRCEPVHQPYTGPGIFVGARISNQKYPIMEAYVRGFENTSDRERAGLRTNGLIFSSVKATKPVRSIWASRSPLSSPPPSFLQLSYRYLNRWAVASVYAGKSLAVKAAQGQEPFRFSKPISKRFCHQVEPTNNDCR